MREGGREGGEGEREGRERGRGGSEGADHKNICVLSTLPINTHPSKYVDCCIGMHTQCFINLSTTQGPPWLQSTQTKVRVHMFACVFGSLTCSNLARVVSCSTHLLWR